jgi:dTDP-4-dehydrorhamnose reductase
MKVLVTGVNGQLGHDMMLELKRRNHEPTGSGSGLEYRGSDSVAAMPYEQMTITDAENVQAVLKRVQPDAVIHCSAWTAVDAAEEEENREKVFSLNVNGTRNIAEACRAIGAKLVYLSTDYVFDGQGTRPWQPDNKNFAPLNVYGQSKLEGEFAVRETLERAFIVRIAWVFGKNGKNFIRTMLNVAKTHDTVRVVNDQIGTPTYTADLARLLTDMIETDRYGCYHATNAETEPGGYISWYDFTREIYRQAGRKVNVIPVSTEEYGLSKAKRPFNSRLDKSKLLQEGFRPLPDWKDALARYLKELDGEI